MILMVFFFYQCWAAETETEEDRAKQKEVWFKFDSLGLSRLPHVISDADRNWRDLAHFVQAIDEDHEHDGFEAHSHNVTA